MTWVLQSDQRKLLDIFSNQQIALNEMQELTAVPDLAWSDGDLLLLWANDPRQALRNHPNSEHNLPDAICVREGEMRAFLAWATTVIGGFRPFTAFFKVIGQESLDLAFRPKQPSLGAAENSLIGLVIGETLAQSDGNLRSVAGLSLLACESTLSFSLARAWALGFGSENSFDTVSAAWVHTRKLTRQPLRPARDELIKGAFGILRKLQGETKADVPRLPPFISAACEEIFERGEVERSWSHLDAPELRGLGEEMKGPREQRVRAFERVLGAVGRLEQKTAEFLTGLLADRIGPGTFEHVELLTPYLERFPMAAAWYGLCAGLNPNSEAQQVGNCLGRRIARDLLAHDPILSHPKYDLSIDELEVCLDREVPVMFRTANKNHMAVELLPGVPSFVKWPVRTEHARESAVPGEVAVPTSGRQTDLFRGSNFDLAREGRAALAEISTATERARAIFDELSRRGVGHALDRGSEHRRRGSRR